MYKKVKDLAAGDTAVIVIAGEDTVSVKVSTVTEKADRMYEISGTSVHNGKPFACFGKPSEEVYVMGDGKSDFVKNHLKPLLLALDMHIKDAEYERRSRTDEVVVITYEGGFKREVNVSCDNEYGITKDVLIRIGE